MIAAILIEVVGSSEAQNIRPDSSDTVYAPIDSLNDGLDLALKALKMTRGDLTFRGDYLEPDAYRLPIVDSLMLAPVKMIEIAGRDFDCQDLPSLIDPGEKESGRQRYWLMEEETPTFEGTGEIFRSDKLNRVVPGQSVSLLRELLHFAAMVDSSNSAEIDTYSGAQLDSLVEGFTLLLEEDVGNEFLSANELDSLEQYEERWASRMAVLAEECVSMRFLSYRLAMLMAMIEKNYRLKVDFGGQQLSWETEFGRIVFGDTTDNHYTGEIFIVIDPGGDDTYDVEFEGTGHHTYIIDYDGNDTYNMPKNRISPYFFGSNMIIDYDGDDSYNAGSWTLGAGLFGVGLLWDMKGNDRYFGDTFTQGAGCFGVGILRDDNGNDTYQAALFSQGFGFVEGIGVLMDNSGNDNYFAGGKYKDFIRYNDHYLSLSQGFGYGWRPKMSGGIGMLIDKSGNDVYISDIFGQGASYWYGLGMLADGGGNDQYISFQYAQGNGTHMSLGILYDVSGDDVYSAKGVSQGCGHDRAAGMLIDLDGDDNYNAYDLCQGAGSANGLGIIADVRGKDVYIVRSDQNTQGYGNPRRDYGSIGIFLDLGGQDGYSGGQGRDGLWWTYSKWGAGIDK